MRVPIRALLLSKPAFRFAYVISLLLVTSAVAFSALARWGAPSAAVAVDAAVGPLQIEKKYFDFGTHWMQVNFDWRVPITNTSENLISIVRFSRSCECTAIQPESLDIPAGATRAIHLKFDLTAIPESENSISVDLTAHTTVRSEPSVQWTFHGRVERAFIVSPPRIRFSGADELVHGRMAAAKSVRIQPKIGVLRIDPQFNPELVEVQFEPENENGPDYLLSVTPRDSLPIGPLSTHVDLVAVLQNGQELPPVRVDVQGRVGTVIHPFPAVVTRFTRSAGGVFGTTLILASQTGAEFHVIEARPSHASMEVLEIPLDPATRHELQIQCLPNAFGHLSGNITITACSVADNFIETFEVPVATYLAE